MDTNFKQPNPLVLNGNLSENWRRFYQTFDIFMEASSLGSRSSSRKTAILLNTIGEEALEIFNSFVFTDEGDKKDYDKVIEKFQSYCNPKKNKTYHRFLFYKRQQQKDEPFDHFFTDISKMVKDCEFKDQDDMLRDKIIFGIQDKELQAKLIKSSDDSELTLMKTTEFCRVAEVTKEQINQVQCHSHGQREASPSNSDGNSFMVAEVHHNNKSVNIKPNNTNNNFRNNFNSNFNRNSNNNYQSRYKNSNNSNNNNQSNKRVICRNCNYTHFSNQVECPALGKICNICNKLNHFASACRSKSKELNLIEINNSDDEFYIYSLYSQNQKIFQRSNDDKTETTWIERLKIDDNLVEFKLDSGADVNILPLKVFKIINKTKLYKVKPISVKLESFGGFNVIPIGCIEMMVETRFGFSLENFFIVDVPSSPILCRKSCVSLGFIKRINVVENTRQKFLYENKDIFEGSGKFPEKCKLLVKENAMPVSKPPHRIPLGLRDKVKNKLDDMVNRNIISPCINPSPWVSKMVVVEKPNKDVRICLDPKDLNQNLIKDYYSLPTLSDLTAELSNKQYFSVLDLKEGFWQIELEEETSKLCTFSTPFGCYKFNRLPYGINLAAEVFQKYNSKYFGNIEGVSIYIDDILISGNTLEEHDKVLEQVVKRAREINIKFNKDKLQYRINEVKYLGHIFSSKGLSPDPERITAILNYSKPTSKKDLQRYLGMVNYLRDFIPNLSELSTPLRLLLKKDVDWCWMPIHDVAIENLNKLITQTPILQNFDPLKDIIIQTDSSKSGIGCCLLQEKKLVTYGSKSLTPTECNYSQIEKEFLAILYSCTKFHSYIYGRKVTVCSDHKPLVGIMNKDISGVHSARLQRIKLKLCKYDLNVTYLPGKEMHIADALSRACIGIENSIDTDRSLNEIVHSVNISDKRKLEFELATQNDELLMELINCCKNGWPSNKKKSSDNLKFYWNKQNDIYYEDGLLFLNNRIIVPRSMRKEMVSQVHMAHFGITKTLKRAKSLLYWPNMQQDIENEINKCRICESYRPSNIKEPLISHEVPQYPYEKVGSDILEYAGENYIVVVDYFSKYIEMIKLKNKTSGELIIHLKKIFSCHGIPMTLIADNVPYSSLEFKKFSESWGFKIITTSPFYAQSNGQAEKAVGIAKNLLKKSLMSGIELDLVLLEYRNTPVCGLKYSPSEMLFSRKTRTQLPINTQLLQPKLVENVREDLVRNNEKTKQYYDQKSKERKIWFDPNDPIVFRKNKRWEPGQIINKHFTPRSYIIRDQNNRIVRRNQIDIKKSFNRPMFNNMEYQNFLDSYVDKNIKSHGTNHANTNNGGRLSLSATGSQASNSQVGNNVEQPSGAYKTKFGRSIRKPERYDSSKN